MLNHASNQSTNTSFDSKFRKIEQKLPIYRASLQESDNFICALLENYDCFESFVDNGHQKSVSTKTNNDSNITIIPGKTLEGDTRHPAYKLEYDVFWALRYLAQIEGVVKSDKFLINFTLNSVSRILGNSLSKNYIKKALSVLATAKFIVKPKQGKKREYRYLKHLRMPTRQSRGVAVFDDAFLEAIDSGKYRKINIKKLLNHTTAGGRFMYQRMSLRFTQAGAINNYHRRWDLIHQAIHRKEEAKYRTIDYIKRVSRDLKKNGTLDISEEEIKRCISAKHLKTNRNMIDFPVSEDLISEIKSSNQKVKANREKYKHLETNDTLDGFEHSWSEKQKKRAYKLNKKPVSQEMPCNIPDKPIPNIDSPLDNILNNVSECEVSINRKSPRLPDQSQEEVASHKKFKIRYEWQPSIDFTNLIINAVEDYKSVIEHFIVHNIAKNKLKTQEEWEAYLYGWIQNHKEKIKQAANSTTLEEQVNDFDW